MKRFIAQIGMCAMLALAACGGGKEEPEPMELGPDTARSGDATVAILAQVDTGRAGCWHGAEPGPSLCIAAQSG